MSFGRSEDLETQNSYLVAGARLGLGRLDPYISCFVEGPEPCGGMIHLEQIEAM